MYFRRRESRKTPTSVSLPRSKYIVRYSNSAEWVKRRFNYKWCKIFCITKFCVSRIFNFNYAGRQYQTVRNPSNFSNCLQVRNSPFSQVNIKNYHKGWGGGIGFDFDFTEIYSSDNLISDRVENGCDRGSECRQINYDRNQNKF